MTRVITGMLLALILLGALAGLSGVNHAQNQLDAIKSDWAEIQSSPPGERDTRRLAELQERVSELRQQFPENAEIKAWQSVVEASWRHSTGAEQAS